MVLPGRTGYVQVAYDSDHRETYGYDADGNLSAVYVADSGYYDNGDGTLTVTPPAGNGALKAQYWYNGQGYLTRQLDYLYDGNSNGTAAYDRQITVSINGRNSSETVVQRQGNDTLTSYVYNYYNADVLTSSSSTVYKNGSYQYTATTSNDYAWYGSAVQSHVSYAQSGQSTKHSYYSYDGWGVLQSVSVQDGRPRSVAFTNDQFGQVIRRDESDNNYSQGDPHEVWYRFNGKQLGYTGNNHVLSACLAGSRRGHGRH